jgi:hypothetical protein
MDATVRTTDHDLARVHQAPTETRNVEGRGARGVTTTMATVGYGTPRRIETGID